MSREGKKERGRLDGSKPENRENKTRQDLELQIHTSSLIEDDWPSTMDLTVNICTAKHKKSSSRNSFFST